MKPRITWIHGFSGTPSNNVEIALGRDADGDGELSFDEAAVRLGWDCGVFFVERVVTGERFEEASVGVRDERVDVEVETTVILR